MRSENDLVSTKAIQIQLYMIVTTERVLGQSIRDPEHMIPLSLEYIYKEKE